MGLNNGQTIDQSDFVNNAARSSSRASDVNKVFKAEPHGHLASLVTRSVYGGDGSDGPLTISSGITNIDVGGAAYFERNYESVSITGSGKAVFINPHANGTVIVIKCLGKMVLTSSSVPNIDASGMGAQGGANATTSINSGGNSNPGKTCSIFQTPAVSGTPSGPNNGGRSIASLQIILDVTTFLPRALIRDYPFIFVGSGGAGAGCANTTGSVGFGGRGGGCLIIECADDINFTVANGISVAGGIGSAASCSGNSGGGGGGGGGLGILFYRSSTAITGTINVAGGIGGAPTGGGSTGLTGDAGLSHIERIK